MRQINEEWIKNVNNVVVRFTEDTSLISLCHDQQEIDWQQQALALKAEFWDAKLASFADLRSVFCLQQATSMMQTWPASLSSHFLLKFQAPAV